VNDLPIALWGFMGSGKSTVGRRLAKCLGWPFVDLDEVLADAHGPIPEQFRQVGEAAFRERERRALADLCDGALRVLATGGGTPMDPVNRARMAEHYRSVFLATSWETVHARLAADAGGRPLWDDAARDRFRRRQPTYAMADRRVETDGRTVDDIVSTIEEVVWTT